MQNTLDCREGFASMLIELAMRDPRVCLVINDCITSSASAEFLKRFPDRVVDVGIAEQNMVGVAAGLANSGRIPFVCAASCFLTGRALEQIKVDIAYSQANVKLCGFSAGFAYGALGPTHHAIEDIAWIRTLPNIHLFAPATPRETAATVKWVYDHEGPAFVRVNRNPVAEFVTDDECIDLSVGRVLKSGTDVTLVSTGVMADRLLDTSIYLSQLGIDAHLLHLPRINPIDIDGLLDACSATGRVVTAEDHLLHGGLGSAVAEITAKYMPLPVLSLGIPGVFAPPGSPDQIFSHFRLRPDQMAADIHRWLTASTRRSVCQ